MLNSNLPRLFLSKITDNNKEIDHGRVKNHFAAAIDSKSQTRVVYKLENYQNILEFGL